MDRSNYEIYDDGVYCCDGDHERAEKCDYYKLSNEAIVGLLQDYRKEAVKLQTENEQLRKDARREVFEDAAQIIRYYTKHQNYPSYDDADEFQKGVIIACENLEELMLEKAMAETK